jgi:hypothetical protein
MTKLLTGTRGSSNRGRHPEPSRAGHQGGTSLARALGLALLLATAACSEAPAVREPTTPQFNVGETDLTPLPITILYNVLSGTIKAGARADAGTAPFTYRWYIRQCPGAVDPIDCPYAYVLDDDTVKDMTASVRPFASGTKIDIISEVREAALGGRSGADTVTIRIPSPTNARFYNGIDCSAGEFGWAYPFRVDRYDYNTGQIIRTDTLYRRNPCTGAKEKKAPA